MKYFLSVLAFLLCWSLSVSCGPNPVVQAVQVKNPNCDILQVKKSGKTVKVILQCPGNRIKTVVMHDNR